MAATTANSCLNCEALLRQVAGLQTQVALWLERVAKLEAELAAARKNSGNSSKPPSSDLAQPPRPKPGKRPAGKRKRGGQPGHPRQERTAFAPQEIAQSWDYALEHCPDCGGRLTPGEPPPRVLQQVEIVPRPLEVSEHRSLACFCGRCQKTPYAPWPAAVRRAGLLGPRLTAAAAFQGGLPLLLQHDPQAGAGWAGPHDQPQPPAEGVRQGGGQPGGGLSTTAGCAARRGAAERG